LLWNLLSYLRSENKKDLREVNPPDPFSSKMGRLHGHFAQEEDRVGALGNGPLIFVRKVKFR
jgi:hypothetical protein